MLRVLIIDDHFIVREGLRRILEDEDDFVVVAEASNGNEGVAAYLAHHPDIVVMDIRMPDCDGLEAIHQILEKDNSAKILVLTSLEDDRDIRRAVAAGARGCLLKNSSGQHLLPALREIAAGKLWFPFQPASLSVSASNSQALSSLDELTTREIEILSLLALGEANKEIGSILGITENTVKSHVKNIREKLGARDRTEAVTLAIRRGIIDLAP